MEFEKHRNGHSEQERQGKGSEKDEVIIVCNRMSFNYLIHFGVDWEA